ncbi:MAG: hypothetical protein MUF06_21560, partial [Pirellulaceae bacterium]|nr:hypothetical protein [Pirellulaceae bacterium]
SRACSSRRWDAGSVRSRSLSSAIALSLHDGDYRRVPIGGPGREALNFCRYLSVIDGPSERYESLLAGMAGQSGIGERD